MSVRRNLNDENEIKSKKFKSENPRIVATSDTTTSGNEIKNLASSSNNDTNADCKNKVRSVTPESIQLLTEMFKNQSDDITPLGLLHVILRDITSDVSEAYKLIVQAQTELRSENFQQKIPASLMALTETIDKLPTDEEKDKETAAVEEKELPTS